MLYLVFIVVPSIMGIYYSLTNWSRFSSETEFVGLDNYRSVFAERGAMWQAIKNTLLFTGLTIVTKTVIGLMLALLVSRGIRRFATVHRAVIYLPSVLPMIVVGIVFKSILNPSTGILNGFLDRRRPRLPDCPLVDRYAPRLVLDRGGRYMEGRRVHHAAPPGRSRVDSA